VILSHKYRYIFLKTNKTAGTSVEIALSKFCGPDDIITPVAPADEELRRSLGYRGPQNHLPVPLTEYGPRDIARLGLRGWRKARFYNHMPAREIVDLVGREIWDSYYKFCFERNPFDRLVSLYYWHNRKKPVWFGRRKRYATMTEFLDSGAPAILKRWGIDSYSLDGRVAVDRVCLYENLEAELEFLSEKLGLPEKIDLPRTKAAHRKDRRDPRDVLTPRELDRVAELFRDEMAMYGYEARSKTPTSAGA
jgi:hypothetical protein